MPENAWQESRDTGLRHLSVGVALYAGLCSGFILLYAPAFLSLLWQALALTPGAACDLLGEAAAPQVGSRQHKATHKLA